MGDEDADDDLDDRIVLFLFGFWCLTNKHCNRSRSISRSFVFDLANVARCRRSNVGFYPSPPEVRHQKEQTAKEPLLTSPKCRHLNAANRQSPLSRSNQSIAGQQRSKQPETSPKMKTKKTAPRPKDILLLAYTSYRQPTTYKPTPNSPSSSSRGPPILPFFLFSLADFPLLLHLLNCLSPLAS